MTLVFLSIHTLAVDDIWRRPKWASEERMVGEINMVVNLKKKKYRGGEKSQGENSKVWVIGTLSRLEMRE